ncbi:hypothetical protein PUW80_03355 [Microbacterium sp. NE1TT3]|uniref:Uncharacterized protein n=2 Tax=Microbacterium thalli TaxID=3027921 RepID=A0ABT5SHM3_9MICO|nr:hypothetical protein [Microbacterium thalli]
MERPHFIEMFVDKYAADLHTRPAHFTQVVESISHLVARTYAPDQANVWSGAREYPPDRDIVKMLIMWAVDAMDRPIGSAERALPEQAIRAQAVDLAKNPNGHLYLVDLVLACAFVGDPDKLRRELDAREAFAMERIGGNPITWLAGP